MKVLARVGEWGFVHTISTGVDNSATFVGAKIHYRDPLGTVTAKTCDVVDAVKGNYGYKVEKDFFTAGPWTAQLVVGLGAADGVRKLQTPVSFLIGDSGE